MDADDDTALKMLSFPRGSNPFLDRERCLLCNCERVDPPEAEAIRAGKGRKLAHLEILNSADL